MDNKNTHEISFEITSPPEEVKRTIEQWMAEDGVETIYAERPDGELFPVARMERHPDCPKAIYEAWKRSMFGYGKEMV